MNSGVAMRRQDFLNELEKLLEMPEGSLKDDEMLKNIAVWDSMAKLSFIVMVENHFSVVLEGSEVGRASSVGDLLKMVDRYLEK